ncbi:MAG: helix-turn-helix domain protein [Alphaproteobacteria bacterium]|jgi:predicted transcriptional regulator|nr:helix-turn-helix domain protein [Alphaproteobacteria bacterium]
MSGHHSFDKLTESMSASSQKRMKKKLIQLRQEMALAEVRRAMSLTQVDLAAMLHIKQAALARLENRTDMYISSLRKYIAALGGELDIVARFPSGEVHIQNLHDLR